MFALYYYLFFGDGETLKCCGKIENGKKNGRRFNFLWDAYAYEAKNIGILIFLPSGR